MKSYGKNRILTAFLALFMLTSCSFFGGEEETVYNIKEVTDFSFLNDKSDALPDSMGGSYDSQWYPGLVQRDLNTGEVTYVWDRDPETLNCLKQYGAIYRGDESRPVCYLTFDCGYEYKDAQYPNGITNAILDVLKEKQAPGTFFVTGDYIESDWPTIQRMYDEGHTVGNHTMHHLQQTTLTPEEFEAELVDANNLLKTKIEDAPDMIYYRPPEGGLSEKTLALAHEMGIMPVLWSATQADYDPENQPDPASALEYDESMLHNGCVYLLHAISSTNAQILPQLIDYIRSQGFEIEPLPNTRAMEEEAAKEQA